MISQKRVILISFDGLLPSKITPERTPNLFAFQKKYVHFTDHRATFPTETYVNQATLVTGCFPNKHGLISNAFYHPATGRAEPFIGARISDIEKASGVPGFLTKSTVGEILGYNNRKAVVLSTNSAGSTRLMHHKAACFDGHVCMSPHSNETAVLPGELKNLYGTLTTDLKHLESPDLNGFDLINESFFQLVDKEVPDLSIIWYGEPDNVFHYNGLRSRESEVAIKKADQSFKEIIRWWEAHKDHENIQIMVMSDHGHIENQVEFSIFESLRSMGFSVCSQYNENDICILPGRAGNIWVKDNNKKLLQDIAFEMMETPWLGMLFSAPKENGIDGIIDGTLATSLVYGDHQYAGDLRFVLRDTEENGFAGSYFCDTLGTGAGNHGGLHPDEVQAIFMCGGSAFAENRPINTPNSVTNTIPTILNLLGLEDYASTMDGHSVTKAIHPSAVSCQKICTNIQYTVGRKNFEQNLIITDTNIQRLIKCGGRSR